MHEEYVMDKKQSSNRSGQTQLKGFGAEGKKGQDVTNKPWPKGNGRRREPSGGSFSSKNEANRKPTPQRNKIVLDKRPKPRGSYYNNTTMAGNEDAWVTMNDTNAEFGSVFVPGSKKQSLNHLLNFHYTPRQNFNGYDRTTMSYNRVQNCLKHKYNKEEFLQATCQFVVNSNGNYDINLKNPDLLVDWDLIEEIHVQGLEFPSCPICLHHPVAAKMTRCGHIYCWSCILHYLALSDKNWRKCPICFEAVHKEDLKSAKAKPFSNLNVSDFITMKLMRRERGSLITIPVDEIEKRDDNILLNISEQNINTIFSKLLLANNNEILAMIIERERNELKIQLSEDENCPEKCFIEQALELLTGREQCILNKTNLSQNKRINKSSKELKNVENDNSDPPAKYFYFYQANDGQHIYLNPLNIKMLERMYGTLENCPTIIEGVIVEKETGSITDDLRKRMRYLQHLPVTCQFEIVELEFKQPVITAEILEFFKDQINNRRKRREKRARDERRHEKRIIEKENRMMGKYPAPNIHIESFHQFPNFMGSSPSDIFSVESSPPLSSSMVESTISISEETLGLSPISDDLSEISNKFNDLSTQQAGPSFATMLTKSKIEKISWPALETKEKTPPKLISVTGKRCRIGFELKHQNYSDSDCEPADGYAPAPAYHKSFSDAIALALEQSANQVCSDEKPTTSIADHLNDDNSSKKKKKRNRKLLFATSMACTGK